MLYYWNVQSKILLLININQRNGGLIDKTIKLNQYLPFFNNILYIFKKNITF